MPPKNEKMEKMELKRVDFSDRGNFMRFVGEPDSISCERSFVNLMIWNDVYEYAVMEWRGRLVVMNTRYQEVNFPFGPYPTVGELAGLIAELKEKGLSDGTVYDVPERFYTEYGGEVAPLFEVDASLALSDYIYDVDHLCQLNGERLRKKRNLIRQFCDGNPQWAVTSINDDNIAEVSKLAIALNVEHGLTDSIEEENIALAFTWKYYRELQVEGLILYAAPGMPVGFSVFSRLNDYCFDVHFEKASRAFKGAAQTVTHEVAKTLQGRVRYVNREQDLGLKGLRQAKESLDPAFLYKRGLLTLK